MNDSPLLDTGEVETIYQIATSYSTIIPCNCKLLLIMSMSKLMLKVFLSGVPLSLLARFINSCLTKTLLS